MQSNYLPCLARILAYEGGKVNNPNDPGGKTNEGITQATYSAWLHTNGRANADVYNISDVDRDAIYEGEYWDVVQCDKLPVGLDLVVFDAAVNSGCGQAAKWLEQALGSAYTGQIDGMIGAKTLDAVSTSDVTALIQGYCSRRLATLKQLSTWKYFGTGWSARIASVQKTALSWVSQAPTPMAPDLSGVSGSAKAPVAGQIKPPVISQIAAHGITAGGAVTTVAAQATSTLQSAPGLADTFAWMKYVLGGLTIASVLAGILVAISTNAKAAAEAGSATATVDTEADTKLPAVPDGKPATSAPVVQKSGG